MPKAFFFDGKHRSEEELVHALQPFEARLIADINSLPGDLTYKNGDQFKSLDDQSIMTYLQGIGVSGWLLNFFDMALTAEFAMEAAEQSALNLLVILSTPIVSNDHYHLMGSHHEVMKFKVNSMVCIF